MSVCFETSYTEQPSDTIQFLYCILINKTYKKKYTPALQWPFNYNHWSTEIIVDSYLHSNDGVDEKQHGD